MAILDKLATVPDQSVKVAFSELLEAYLQPAFGSMSKRDFDILLFSKLQQLGLIETNPDLYDVVTNLRVTRAKARNLIYEVKLRNSSSESLDLELKKCLSTALFLKDADKRIGIEIDNPLLTDHLRARLKRLNHLSDGSFSPELVKLTPDAYTDLVLVYLGSDAQERMLKVFRKQNILPDTSAKGILKSILKKLGEKVAGEAGDAVVNHLSEIMSPIFSNQIDTVESKLLSIFKSE